METLLLLASFIVPAGVGFLCIKKLDRFLTSGAVHPFWNRAAEQAAQKGEAGPEAPQAVVSEAVDGK